MAISHYILRVFSAFYRNILSVLVANTKIPNSNSRLILVPRVYCSTASGPITEAVMLLRVTENPQVCERKQFKNIYRLIK